MHHVRRYAVNMHFAVAINNIYVHKFACKIYCAIIPSLYINLTTVEMY